MTQTPVALAPVEGARGAASPSWDERVRAALVERRELTYVGVSAMADDDLVALGKALGVVRKDADRMMAVVAAVQAERSRAKKKVGLARQRGKGDERGIVSSQTGGSDAEAGRLIELGEALRDAERAQDAQQAGDAGGVEGAGDAQDRGTTPSQPPLPDVGEAEPTPVFPEVAKAVNAGQLGVEASAMIVRMLRRVAKRCSVEAVAKAERDLVSSARFMRLNRLVGLITRTEERLDSEHLEELAAARRERRFLRIGETPDGMVSVKGQLDPENGAPLVAVMQAMVNQNFRLRKRAKDAVKAGESVIVDERTPEQVRADAMGDFARHLAGCDVEVLPRSGVTLVVRTNMDQLREGMGGATIDGLSTLADAGALRRAAAAAGIIPQVMDGKSVVLDQGRRKRHFTHEQKLALAERDGGCAMCGAPPSWCDAHHIEHWSHGGTTNMANGVLLCVRCHHDIHRDDWQIHATSDQVWFTPPATVDSARRRRPGGRRLFDTYPLEPDASSGPDEPPGATPDLLAEDDRRCALVAREPCLVVRIDSRSRGGERDRRRGRGRGRVRSRRATHEYRREAASAMSPGLASGPSPDSVVERGSSARFASITRGGQHDPTRSRSGGRPSGSMHKPGGGRAAALPRGPPTADCRPGTAEC